MARRQERGFAAMDPEQQREIARLGGRAAHQRGTAHEWTVEEAARAGRKGGEAVSRDRAYMAEIGRRGGKAAHQRTAANQGAAVAAPPAGRPQRAQADNETARGRSGRGFAAMNPTEQREIARQGGEASHGGRGQTSKGGMRSRSAAQPARAGRQGRRSGC